MRAFQGAILAFIVVVLNGCATPPPKVIEVPQSFDATNGRIGVAMTAMPKPDTYFPGAGCLLCIATASAANSGLTDHAKTLSAEDLPKLTGEVAGLIRKRGGDAIIIAEEINVENLPDNDKTGEGVPAKNFRDLAKKYSIDHLVVLNVATLGFVRTYSAYFPTSDPKGTLVGTGYMVDLRTNTYEWYQPVKIEKSSDGKWDEPPSYPGLTNAYFQALELGKDAFTKPFLK